MEVVYCKVYKETAIKIAKRFLLLFCLIFIFSFQSVAQVDAATITMSGTLYTDEGVTTAGSGKTIKIAVGTSTPSVHSTTTASDGTWQITDIDNASLSTTTPFSVWLDGDVNDATTLVMGYSGSNITGIPLYYAYTLANATSSTATINVGSFAFYDSGDDSDILYLVTSTSTTINSNLLIKQGVFSAPTTTLSISGNYKNNGTLSNNYGSIFLTGVSNTIDGSLTGSNAFYNLNISGSYTISTTSASTTNVFIKNTGSLVAPQNLTVSGNFANPGTFDGNGGTIYIDNARDEIMSYLAGRDANGLSNGTSSMDTNSIKVVNDYLYIGKNGSATACSQTAGSASGCELQVYDISSSTNPIYVAGRDTSGSSAGTGNVAVNSLAISGNYLYVGKSNNVAACSQTAGSATGCELMVFDISSSTNPTYVAGRDSSGNSTGTGAEAVNFVEVASNYLYIGKNSSSTACSQTAGSAYGCELMVFDISSTTNPTYVAGRDASGSGNGTGAVIIYSLKTYGNYIYVGKGGNSTACSQTAGSATGCELMVFDISSTTNPTYVAGRDVSGNSVGTGNIPIYNIQITGDNYIYVGKGGNSTACSQTAGSATGCELMVFDISSTTNPTYVAGRDSSGNSTGVDSISIFTYTISGAYLYVGKNVSTSTCSQTAGSAQGCELMVFDISSTTNPVYLVGKDSGGDSGGTSNVSVNTLEVAEGYLYVGKSASSTACSQTAGSAGGCELMVFYEVAGVISGNLTSSSSLNSITIVSGESVVMDNLTITGNYTNNGTVTYDTDKNLYLNSNSAQTLTGNLTDDSSLPNVFFQGTGAKTFSDNASTSDFVVEDSSSVVLPSVLTILGEYTNNGVVDNNGGNIEIKDSIDDYLVGRDVNGDDIGTGGAYIYSISSSNNYIYLGKGASSTACSQTTGSAGGCELMVFDVSSSTNPTYIAGRDASGNSGGTGSVAIATIITYNDYLYVGKAGNSTACSQTAGSATGCELMVFDISSTTNPTYVAGLDSNGLSTGTSSIAINSLYVDGNYLYAGKVASSTACSQTAGGAIGCELMVFDISSSTNPTYVAGLDSNGLSTGTSSASVNSLTVSSDYLYVGKAGNATACSQTAGSALGCELMVFDISSTTNPTYVAGRDVSGSSAGTGNVVVNSLTVSSDYLYVGKAGNATACSQTAGSALGCELMVFDISSSTNPTYVAGRDVNGDSVEIGDVDVNSIQTIGSYLYVGKAGDATICSQASSFALGCELMVFDISSTTNPVYTSGHDSSGSSDGTGSTAVYALATAGNNLYIGKIANYTACSQTAGSADGCELMTFDISSTLSGNMTGTSDFNNLTITGIATMSDNASTTNLTIATSSTLTAPSYLTVSGDLSNYGTFTHSSGTVILSGTSQDLVSPATTTFYNLTKSVSSADTLTFTAGGTYVTEGELTLNGASGNRLSLRSSSTTGEWYIDPQATATVSYLDVKDSNNINVTTITCTTGCLDSGNNTNWTFDMLFGLLSGTLYTDAGITEYSATSKTIKAVVDGVDVYSTTTVNGTGDWTIDTGIATGSVITLYVDGEPSLRAVVVTKTVGTNDITNLNLYQDHLIIRSEEGTSTPITNSILGTYDGSDDSDILYTVTDNALTQTAGQSLYVYTNTSYLPEGEVTVGGSLIATSTAVTSFSTTTFNFIATSSATITAPTTFDNLIFNSATGDWAVTDDATTTDFTILDGSVTAPTTLTINGNFRNSDTFDSNGGTINMSNTRDEVMRYLAGRDTNGDSGGAGGGSAMNTMVVSGNYLYVGKAGNSTVCSQTAGSATGCELMVFDISSSTNPTYVAGRDTSGSSGGTGNIAVNSLTVSGNYLYVGKGASATACSQTAGSATGCELMVFDISSSTNPTYVAGRDATGDSTGTSSVAINSLIVSGNYLYVGKAGNSTACSQTAGSAIGCELMVFDISSSTNPTYVSGRDVKGDSVGTGNYSINSFAISGNYLYVGKGGVALTCSQTVGSTGASYCQLQVYDISSSTNPIYVAGRNSDGASNGNKGPNINSIDISGNYLYVGKDADVTTCSQTAGSADGCEIQVYDISSSTNPVYVWGRDTGGGLSAGVLDINVNKIIVSGDYLYVGKYYSTELCSQYSSVTQGCELMVFDISSSTNPTYILGQDADTGSSVASVLSLIVNNNYLYVGKSNNATACSQTAGSAVGCELTVFDAVLVGIVGGNIIDTNTLADLTVSSGAVRLINDTSISDLTISSGSSLDILEDTTITGNYTNNGTVTYDTDKNLYLNSNSAQTLAGNLTNDSSLPNVFFQGTGAKTFSNNASTSDFVVESGSTIVAPTVLTIASDFINNGTFDNNNGSAKIEAYISDYVAGLDSDGSGSGTLGGDINAVIANGNYLYIGKSLDATACSQTAGSADGCELQVYDISSSTNPTYVAGRDSSGSSSGSGAILINSLTISGNYLYVGKNGSATACSQTAGSASGCELMVFDISSSTNPTYVAGRDVNGLSNGTSSIYINSLTISGDYLYVGKNSSATACSQTAGSADGCELQVYDISSSTNPTYVVGRDSSGNSDGTGNNNINDLVINGNYLYVGKYGNITACSQTAGSAFGCELMVFDISSSTNPTYVAGRDIKGDDVGTGNNSINDLVINGNSLYVGKDTFTTACSQTAGSAIGCELMVFDISSSTNPTYVAGRDVKGDSVGTGGITITSLTTFENYLYVGKAGDATACSQTAGSAIGCEIMVFDISSSTNPTYVAGKDLNGNGTGDLSPSVLGLHYANNQLYIGKDYNDTNSCSQTAGLAIGCELMVFDISSTLSGTMTGTSDFNNLTITGIATMSDNASTTNLTIATSSTLTAPSYLTVSGNLSNYGTYTHNNGTVILSGTSQNLVSPATTTFYNLTKSVSSADTLTFTVGGTYVTEGELTLNGASGNRLSLRSSSTTGEWYIDPQATTTVSYLDVKDSNNINVTTITCTTGCLDSGNNTNWFMSMVMSILSGNIYTDTGITNYTVDGKAVRVVVDGADTYDTTTTGGNGAWSVEAGITASSTLTVFVDGEPAFRTALVTRTVSTSSITNLNLYQDYLIVRSEEGTSTPITNSILGTYDGSDDSDILYTVTDNALTQTAGQSLYVYTNTSYLPEGEVTVGKSLISTSTAVTNFSTTTFNFIATSSASINGPTAFDNMNFNSATGDWTFANNATTTNLTIIDGSVTAPTTLTINGNFRNSDTFDSNSGTLRMDTGGEVVRYIKGIDASGDNSGTGLGSVFAFATSSNYLYVGKSASSTACSQTAGSASGCELMVFDISSTTNPVYFAGRDASGDASGTGAVSINTLVVKGDYLYVGKSASSTACSQTAGSAAGCELMVFDISSSTNPVYVAGRDIDGTDNGVYTSTDFLKLIVNGDYLYIGKVGDAGYACSDDAYYCELQIYDISSSTNPVYVTGLDSEGTKTASTGSAGVMDMSLDGGYLYVGKDSNDYTACSQTAGSADGCELQVYDISSSTNPTYVAGRDGGGTATGIRYYGTHSMLIDGDYLYVGKEAGLELMIYDISSSTNPTYVAGQDTYGGSDDYNWSFIYSLAKIGDYLYAGKYNEGGECSQIAGGASGCDLLVFDVSSSTNPTYVAGIVSGGTVYGLLNYNDKLFVGKSASSTACSQTAGSADGCEFMVYNGVSGVLSGNLSGASTLNNLYVDGKTNLIGNASTTDISVSSNSEMSVTNNLTISSDYTNDGTTLFDQINNLYLTGNSAQNLIGNMVATSSLPNVYMSGSGAKVFANNASTSNVVISNTDATFNSNLSTTDLTIGSGSSLSVTGDLVIKDDFINDGNSTTGNVYIESYVSDYLAGRDTSGNSSGTGGVSVTDLVASGNYLYVAKYNDSTACSQTAGSAIGCELMVFDISSSTNPVYVAGRDTSGNSSGTGSNIIDTLVINGNYLYVGKDGQSTACSQTAGSAIGCELMIFDISSSTNPTYKAGLDASGSSNGTSSVGINKILINGDYMFIAKDRSSTACSQTAGLARGCELMVFDISSSTNPVYKAGRDVSGNSSGTGNFDIWSISTSSDYLYIGKSSSATACSQTAGSASGCELQVYDISSSTNPTYKAGRDVLGNSSGTGLAHVYEVNIKDNYLFLGKSASSTACSQTAGSADGCELQVYDISSSTNPTYVAGRDGDGSSNGTNLNYYSTLYTNGDYLYVGSTDGLMIYSISSSTNPVYVEDMDSLGVINDLNNVFTSIIIHNNLLYVSKNLSTTACSQTAGSADGCELMAFDIPSTLSGNMTGTSDFNNLTITGIATMSDNASTTNLTIATSSTLTAPSYLTVAGDLSNYGTYTHNNGTVILSGTSQDLVSPATTTFYNLTKSVSSADTLTFTAGGTYVTEGELTLNGASGNRLSLRSSSTTGEWYIDPQATATVSYLDVKDSNNINVTTITCTTGCLDSGNNTNWTFGDSVSLSSTDNYHFYVGQATTTLDTVTVTKQSSSTDIVVANDLRIHISTSTTNFYFDVSNTTLTFGGTASGKVNGTVSYEDNGTTLVIDVTEDFINTDTLTISGIEVGNFTSISTTSSNLLLYTSGSITGSAITDDKSIMITGLITVANHTLGQTDNQFSFQNKNDETMFAFNLSPSGENATVTDMVITLSGIQEVTSDEISDFKLYRDLDSDGALSGGDELLDGGGILMINGQHGAITFSTDFLSTSTADYIVTFDTIDIDRGDSFMVSLPTSGITAAGITSIYSSYLISTVSNIQHERHGAGAGGSSGRIGDDAPAGNGIVTGGDEGGGGGADEGTDGENIVYDPNFIKPSATGDIDNEWTNPSNALNSDGAYATAGSATLKQSYNGFSFGIPGGNTILGIEVKVDASGSTADGTIDVALSWDGGSSYTTGKATPTLSGTDIVYSVGGSGDTWGRSWTATEFNPTNFRLRVTANPSSNTLRLDALEVRVYHQSTGGGGGGGGGI